MDGVINGNNFNASCLLPTISCGIICDDHKMLGLEKHLKIYTKLEEIGSRLVWIRFGGEHPDFAAPAMEFF